MQFLRHQGWQIYHSETPSVLPSITNMSLRQLARDMGLEVEDRKIPVEELASFEECGGAERLP